MKDALGHGSDAHNAGVQQLPVKAPHDPRGGPSEANRYTQVAAAREAAGQELGGAFYRGAAMHAAGGSLKDNPGHPDPRVKSEWDRGFKNTQLAARRDATIATKRLNRPLKAGRR